MTKALDSNDYSDLKAVGMDETSKRKGHDYITLFVDLLKKRTTFIAEGKGHETVLDMQKSELALKLATIPETLSRNLKKLKTRKMISLKDNRVTILNPESLRQLAENL